jgi:hypothetical protein
MRIFLQYPKWTSTQPSSKFPNGNMNAVQRLNDSG